MRSLLRSNALSRVACKDDRRLPRFVTVLVACVFSQGSWVGEVDKDQSRFLDACNDFAHVRRTPIVGCGGPSVAAPGVGRPMLQRAGQFHASCWMGFVRKLQLGLQADGASSCGVCMSTRRLGRLHGSVQCKNARSGRRIYILWEHPHQVSTIV